jgi:hypothetical protein
MSNSASKPKLGSGERYAALVNSLSKRGVKDPRAMAAAIGRKKYGKEQFQKMAAAGRRRSNNG